jgi:hypothetical protein
MHPRNLNEKVQLSNVDLELSFLDEYPVDKLKCVKRDFFTNIWFKIQERTLKRNFVFEALCLQNKLANGNATKTQVDEFVASLQTTLFPFFLGTNIFYSTPESSTDIKFLIVTQIYVVYKSKFYNLFTEKNGDLSFVKISTERNNDKGKIVRFLNMETDDGKIIDEILPTFQITRADNDVCIYIYGKYIIVTDTNIDYENQFEYTKIFTVLDTQTGIRWSYQLPTVFDFNNDFLSLFTLYNKLYIAFNLTHDKSIVYQLRTDDVGHNSSATGKIGIVGMYENNTNRKFICISEHPCRK